jgi:hypothetical protein
MTKTSARAAAASIVAMSWLGGCATTPGFETGRALPAGETRVLVGLSLEYGREAWGVPRDLPFGAAWFLRASRGLGDGFDADATVTLPGLVCSFGACNVGVAAGLKKGDESADAVAAAVKVEAGIDFFGTIEPRAYRGLRLHGSGRLIGSWHPGERDALYAAPYVLGEWLASSEQADSAAGAEGEPRRIARRGAALTTGAVLGWKHLWPGDERPATYVEVDGRLTPRSPFAPGADQRLAGRLGLETGRATGREPGSNRAP